MEELEKDIQVQLEERKASMKTSRMDEYVYEWVNLCSKITDDSLYYNTFGQASGDTKFPSSGGRVLDHCET